MLGAFSKNLVYVGPWGPQKMCDRRELVELFSIIREITHTYLLLFAGEALEARNISLFGIYVAASAVEC